MENCLDMKCFSIAIIYVCVIDVSLQAKIKQEGFKTDTKEIILSELKKARNIIDRPRVAPAETQTDYAYDYKTVERSKSEPIDNVYYEYQYYYYDEDDSDDKRQDSPEYYHYSEDEYYHYAGGQHFNSDQDYYYYTYNWKL